MEGQRQRARERRRRKARPKRAARAPNEPILIAARRPDSPRVKTPGRSIAASARPRKTSAPPEAGVAAATTLVAPTLADSTPSGPTPSDPAVVADSSAAGNEKPRRTARIVQPTRTQDEFELVRGRLLQRLLDAQGPSAITQAADALAEQRIDVPEEQELQVQLLEHSDERRARQAVDTIARLLAKQPPRKRPILERRLSRLEQAADDPELRASAGALRKAIRAA